MLERKSGNIINMASVASSIKGKDFLFHPRWNIALNEKDAQLLKNGRVCHNPLISDNCFPSGRESVRVTSVFPQVCWTGVSTALPRLQWLASPNLWPPISLREEFAATVFALVSLHNKVTSPSPCHSLTRQADGQLYVNSLTVWIQQSPRGNVCP